MKPYAAMSAYTERLLRFSRLATDFSVRVLRGVAWPKVELVIRLWLAQIFFVSSPQSRKAMIDAIWIGWKTP